MEHVNPYGTYEFPVEAEYVRISYRAAPIRTDPGRAPRDGPAVFPGGNLSTTGEHPPAGVPGSALGAVPPLPDQAPEGAVGASHARDRGRTAFDGTGYEDSGVSRIVRSWLWATHTDSACGAPLRVTSFGWGL
ncbi:hypothetical protein Acsp05_03390 [Actinokineospora sp. NBRC 105648]|nr:hypothetical protein Acsp05_03390 [Actinokineospora sp. NBRC 105648]